MATKSVTGMWKKVSAAGKAYYSGKAQVAVPVGARLMLFPVDEKTNENSPDVSLSMAIDDDQAPASAEAASPPTEVTF